jgi:hypothetical protein
LPRDRLRYCAPCPARRAYWRLRSGSLEA